MRSCFKKARKRRSLRRRAAPTVPWARSAQRPSAGFGNITVTQRWWWWGSRGSGGGVVPVGAGLVGAGPSGGWSQWEAKISHFFPFPTFFSTLLYNLYLFFVDLCQSFTRFDVQHHAKHTNLEFSAHLVKPRQLPQTDFFFWRDPPFLSAPANTLRLTFFFGRGGSLPPHFCQRRPLPSQTDSFFFWGGKGREALQITNLLLHPFQCLLSKLMGP